MLLTVMFISAAYWCCLVAWLQMMQAQMQSAGQLGRAYPGGDMQMNRAASGPRLSSPNITGAVPAGQPSPTLRSSSGMMGNPMLMQEHRTLAMDSGMQGTPPQSSQGNMI